MRFPNYLSPTWVRSYVKSLLARVEQLESKVRNIDKCLEVMIESPRYNPTADWAFNGQSARKQIFHELLSVLPIRSIIETGTFVAETTGYLAMNFDGPIHTCEFDQRFLALAMARLRDFEFSSRIAFHRTRSTDLLSQLTKTEVTSGLSFFYLDAHWYSHLPIREELDLIATFWKRFCVMIDDFQVPNDQGYGFDDYGGDQVLRIETLIDLITKHELAAFFPTCPSHQETGGKRGCVVLVRESDAPALIEGAKSIYRLGLRKLARPPS